METDPWNDETNPLYDKYYETLSVISDVLCLDPVNIPDYVISNVQNIFRVHQA